MAKFLGYEGLQQVIENFKNLFVTKNDADAHFDDTTVHVSSSDRTNWNSAKTHADSSHAPVNAQANVIESVKVNGTALAVTSKAVNVTVPTKTSELTNDSGFKTTDNNTTYTLTQDADDGHVLTFTPSSGTATTITIPDNNTTYSNATTSTAGLMSSSDKSKLDGIATGANKTIVDSAMSSSSTNPVQNKVVNSAILSSISTHNSSTSAHSDIRDLITGLTTRLNALADSDDTTLDQMSEIVAYIKANRDLIESITTDKVSVSDIVNNLTSTATNKPLSANQGKVLNDLITALTAVVDGKSDTGHTHNYAGSSSAGGAATSANKLNKNAGSATQPVYFENGVPVATTYSLNKTVPSDAKFTDTDVRNTAGSTNSSSKLFLIGATSQDANPQTYSHDTAYVGTDGCLYSGSAKVLTAHPTIDVVSDTTNTASPAHSGTFTTIDSVDRDGNGHILKVNTKTVTMPAIYTHPSYTARTGVPTANATPAFGGTFTVSQPVSDATGHITAINSRTITIPNTTVSTSANGLMISTDKAKLNYTNVAYGTCSTAAATAAKVITVSGNTNWALTAGSRITVKFSNTNTAQNPTFNVNGTGAKSVWVNTGLITTGNLSYAGYANRPMEFVYDGTQYVFVGWSVDNNSDTKATQTNTTTNADYRLVLSTNANDTTETNTLRKSTQFKANPSTGQLTSTSLNVNGAVISKVTSNGKNALKISFS